MASIRRANIEDLLKMQNSNLWCLPENYTFKYYYYHYACFPHLLYIAEVDGNIAGYVLAKIDEELEKEGQIRGHITSLAVLRTYRKMGRRWSIFRYCGKTHGSRPPSHESHHGRYRCYSARPNHQQSRLWTLP